MKRLLSLILSALILLQIENANCYAASHWNEKSNYNSVGAAYKGQSIVMQQPVPQPVPQPQPQQYPKVGYQMEQQSAQTTSAYVYPPQEVANANKKSILSTVFSVLLPVASLGVGALTLILSFFSTALGWTSDVFSGLKSIFNRNNKPPQPKEERDEKQDDKNKEKEDNADGKENCQCSMNCCEEIKAILGRMEEAMSNSVSIGGSNLSFLNMLISWMPRFVSGKTKDRPVA